MPEYITYTLIKKRSWEKLQILNDIHWGVELIKEYTGISESINKYFLDLLFFLIIFLPVYRANTLIINVDRREIIKDFHALIRNAPCRKSSSAPLCIPKPDGGRATQALIRPVRPRQSGNGGLIKQIYNKYIT